MDTEIPRTLQGFQLLREWWRADDAAWVAERKKVWKGLRDQLAETLSWSAQRTKLCARFFVYGEEPELVNKEPMQRIRLTATERFLLTPVATPQDAKRLFDAFLHPRSKEELMGSFMQTACAALSGTGLARETVRVFSRGVMGDEYRLVEVPYGPPGRSMRVSPGPAFWTEGYIATSLKFIKGTHENEYSYVIDTILYFMSALRYLEAQDTPVARRLDDLVTVVVSTDTGSLTKLQGELVDRLREAFSQPDAPNCIKRAYRAAVRD